MMTMTINTDIKIAIAQFGNPDDEVIKEMAEAMTEKGIHWYYFDETADEEFELNELCAHYPVVFKCIDRDYMEKIER